MNYEDMIESIANLNDETTECVAPLEPEALESAQDAMGFVLALHNFFKANGVNLPDNPDVATLENCIDGLAGELAVACLLLSEDSFEGVPRMLRVIAKSIDDSDTPITDSEGVHGPSVPVVIRKGYTRLADRIDATKKQRAAAMEILAGKKLVTT